MFISRNEVSTDGAKDVSYKRTGGYDRWNDYNRWGAFFLTFIMLLSATCQANSDMCVHRMDHERPSCTSDQDIVVEYGLSVQVHCSGIGWSSAHPQFRSKRVSSLEILVNDKAVEPKELISTNENTLTLSLVKPPPSKFTFGCRRKLDNIDGELYADQHVQVFIGFKPKEPRNFKCTSYNWENLVCTWDPVPNDVPTRFSLRFESPGLIAGTSSFTCSPPQDEHKLPPNSCLWDGPADPFCRLTNENYTFILDAENVLGNDSFTYKFNHWANVVPSRPVNLSVVSKTSSSVLLHWSVPYPMQDFPPGLHYRISYQNPWDRRRNWHYRTIYITNELHASEIYFNLTNLEFSNAVYYVRVSMKSSLAVDADMWGQFADITFKTAATPLCLPARTDIGSFESVGNRYNRNVYIYWQAIPGLIENEEKYPYQVVCVEENGRKLNVRPDEVTRTYAKFTDISFNSLKFEIVATNCPVGNNHATTIRIPSQLELPEKPVAFTKIAYDGGVYELSWNRSNNRDIVNYTIFWCENNRDRPYQCSGNLDWVHVPADANTYTTTVPDPKKVYQFAISANTERSSSGIVWFSGMTTFSNVFGKMKSIWMNHIESELIEVGWELDCSDRINMVEGFNLYYCPIQSAYNLDCKGPKVKKTLLTDFKTQHGVVRGLKPFTNYVLTVAVMSKNGDSLHTDPLFFTTLEAAPSPPQTVVLTNVTPMMLSVEWQPPFEMNGLLRYYAVYYNWRPVTKIEKATRVDLQDIEPDRGFCVSIAACTVWCTMSAAVCAEPKNYTMSLPWKP